MLAFIGVRPGSTVLDLSAGGGYTTELLARAVGTCGHVYGQSAPRDPGRAGPAAPEGANAPVAAGTGAGRPASAAAGSAASGPAAAPAPIVAGAASTSGSAAPAARAPTAPRTSATALAERAAHSPATP